MSALYFQLLSPLVPEMQQLQAAQANGIDLGPEFYARAVARQRREGPMYPLPMEQQQHTGGRINPSPADSVEP